MPGPTGLALVCLGLGLVSLPIAAIIDAARHPLVHWSRVGASRTTWILLMGLGTVLGVGVVGVVAALEYLISVRPKLELAAEMGSALGDEI
jgi:hypothetical protein